LKAVKAAYEKAYESRLEDDIKGKCNEDTQKLYAPLLQGNVIQQMHHWFLCDEYEKIHKACNINRLFSL
jgi:hypothetical protein